MKLLNQWDQGRVLIYLIRISLLLGLLQYAFPVLSSEAVEIEISFEELAHIAELPYTQHLTCATEIGIDSQAPWLSMVQQLLRANSLSGLLMITAIIIRSCLLRLEIMLQRVSQPDRGTSLIDIQTNFTNFWSSRLCVHEVSHVHQVIAEAV